MIRVRCLTLAAALAATAPIGAWTPPQGSAPAHPDFSGRWTAEAPAATGRGARGDLGTGWGSPLTIAQTASSLTVEYAFFTRGDLQPPLKFEFALDGRESRNSVMMGRGVQVQTSRTAWDADALVITTQFPFVDPDTGRPAAATVRHRISLTTPDTLTIDTTRDGVLGGPSSASHTTFKKG